MGFKAGVQHDTTVIRKRAGIDENVGSEWSHLGRNKDA